MSAIQDERSAPVPLVIDPSEASTVSGLVPPRLLYDNGQYLTCSHITVDGTSLTKGPDLVVNSGNARWIDGLMTELQAMVCYQDRPNSDKVTCKTLTLPPNPPIAPPPASPPAPIKGIHLSDEDACVHFGPNFECKLGFDAGPPPKIMSSCALDSPPPPS